MLHAANDYSRIIGACAGYFGARGQFVLAGGTWDLSELMRSAFVAALCLCGAAPVSAGGQKPSIVFILADVRAPRDAACWLPRHADMLS